MHIGTVTPDGTWLSPLGQLPAIAELGFTTLAVLPIGDFAGDLHLEPAPEPLLAPPRGANWKLLW